jgi:hypothetical protein
LKYKHYRDTLSGLWQSKPGKGNERVCGALLEDYDDENRVNREIIDRQDRLALTSYAKAEDRG